MKKIALSLMLLFSIQVIIAQQPGDTIVVKGFKYGNTSRDSVLSFPSGNLTFEKVILKYNMRCKNALISNQTYPNQGCGEWDYSCNSFIVDSSRIEEVLSTQPSHTITNFSGTSYKYTTAPLYDYFRFRQISVGLDSVLSESQSTVGTGTTAVSQLLKTNETSGKSQILYTAAELLAAGFTAGNINGILLSVANAGGQANFFKLGIQHTSASALNIDSVTLSGFTNVFNSNFTFVNGANRVQFHTPFYWNGTGNLLLELTFTNTVPGNAVVLNGHNTSALMSLFTNNNNALDLSGAGLVTLNTSYLSTIGSEITVTFRSFGNPDLLPVSTSILYGYSNNSGQRQLNIHLPHSNSNIYFDCGYSGTYDRIFKVAIASEYEGQWNHWAFTKNAATGNMSIYLNGILWHSGANLTKTISILNLMLGNNNLGTANYKGKVNELTFWNKALPQSEIQAWKNKPIDSSHPSWANLVAYYKASEGSGSSITDSKNSVVSSGTNLAWAFDRGDKLNSLFSGTQLRPNIVFLRGTYILDTISVFVTDSLKRTPNVVNSYAIIPAPVGTMQNDSIALVSTSQLYQALPLKVTDGDTDTLITTIGVVPQDSILITTLNYYKRYPFYNEIMSFVTPYGKGLDLGVTGKTWYFDVTDFAPLLKGNKRFMMTGGVNQEELDIDFLFIVGTPPRDVLEFRQLYQGYARAGEASIASINNDTRFPPVSVPLLPNGQYFKVRSTITGHGSEGEFSQNGGNVYHYFRVNGTTNNFTWLITEECSFNPVFPQGGTWVYDRQGWCPGQYSLLKELNITPLVTAGSTATLDYHCSPPSVSAGDYRYLAAIQLVTYGGANRTLDANLVDVPAPSQKVVYSRKNPICANPVVVVQNTGSTTLSSIVIEYWLNNATTKQTHTWTGSLAYMDTLSIKLPINSLWQNGFQASGNVFHAEITAVNGVADNYPHNNKYHSPFAVTDILPQQFIVEFKTNNYPSHNTYRIVDEDGIQVPGTSNLTTANFVYRDTLDLNGCYTLKVTDAGGDGLQWWANTAQGNGYVSLKALNGNVIKSFQSDFGGGFEYSFTSQSSVGMEESTPENEFNLYPNPASDHFVITGAGIGHYELLVQDMMGKAINLNLQRSADAIVVETSALPPGVYFVSLTLNNSKIVKRVVIE